MYKQIIAHRDYINNKLEANPPEGIRQKLLDYHNTRVRDFQHERLIHLLVTFFFSALLLVAVFVRVLLVEPLWPLSALVMILFVLELFYIRHYYQLENSVQSLYEITEKLGK